jgi:NRPS condensation-like uncharacterized protein
MNQEIPHRLPAVALDRITYLNQAFWDQQFHYVVAFDDRLDEGRLGRAVRLALDAEPVLGCRYVLRRRPYWERRDDLDSISICEVVETSDVQTELSRFAGRPCDAAVDPLLQSRIFRGPADTLCLKINHVATDGAGGKDLLYLIASIYRNLQDPTYRVRPNLGSRSRLQLFRHFSFREYLRAWRHMPPRPPENVWSFPSTNREARGERMFSTRRLPEGRFDDMNAYAKQFGATLSDVFVTAYFRSLWEFLDFPADVPQAILLPMNLRRYLPSGRTEAICNFTAPLFPSLARIRGESFEGTLKRVRERTMDAEERKQRILVGPPAISLGARLALPRMQRMVKAASRKGIANGKTTAALSNNGSLDLEQMDFGIPVTDAYQIVQTAFAPWLILAIISFRKTLMFTMSYSSVAMKPADVERFLDVFMEQLSL